MRNQSKSDFTNVCVEMTKKMKSEIAAKAKAANISMSEYIRRAIVDSLTQ